MRSALARSALVLATVLLAAVASAQSTGNLYGTALDALGNPVSGARVTITGPGAVQTANTDAKGNFRFLNLTPGGYSVELERAGFGTARQAVTVSLGNAVVSVVMPVAGVVEAVTVDAEATPDNRKSQTGATFGQKELESIPTTRDPWAILRQVPGVLLPDMNVGGGRRSRQSSFVGKGSHADQNSYNLDGIPNSRGGISPLYYDFDTFNSIQVATGGSDPSLATPGVTLNLVTRRGTNELLGSARVLYTGGAGWDYGIGVGGPRLEGSALALGRRRAQRVPGPDPLCRRRARREPGNPQALEREVERAARWAPTPSRSPTPTSIGSAWGWAPIRNIRSRRPRRTVSRVRCRAWPTRKFCRQISSRRFRSPP